jgi:hypothetical protein
MGDSAMMRTRPRENKWPAVFFSNAWRKKSGAIGRTVRSAYRFNRI